MKLRIIGIAVVAGLCVGCSDSTQPTSIYGTYPLRTVHGEPLPVAIREFPNYTFKITGGTITLESDSTFSESYNYWRSWDGEVTTGTIPCSGTWTRTAAWSFTLHEAETLNCGDSATGEWDGRNVVAVTWSAYGFGAMVYAR